MNKKAEKCKNCTCKTHCVVSGDIKQIKPDLSVFVGSGFDMEFKGAYCNYWIAGYLVDTDIGNEYIYDFRADHSPIVRDKFCRPRLNKPQVLDDYSFIESLDGFVWDVMFEQNVCFGDMDETARTHLIKNQSSKNVSQINNTFSLIWLSFVAVHESSPFVAWARANDVPVLNDAGEVVK